ncbi:hypothetical protein ACJMK2_007633 [Sinanodonta woodiana]|uniref:Lysophospholipid acyltransferase 5 n=1 Tax=Sinanodonta woodiana TaxID=1069815 RepID=A0ABD3VLL5_SINWO
MDGIVKTVAVQLGTTDSAIRLLTSLFLGFPLGFVHRAVIHGKPSHVQHLYFTFCGLVISYFNFGWELLHPLINICSIWVLLLVAGGTKVSVGVAFTFNTGYLILGYLQNTEAVYNISWTLAQCVLTLRLTGVVVDVYDGKKGEEKLSAEQKESALTKSPSLLELLGHTYCFCGFLVGPQYSMKRYMSFTQGAFTDSWRGGIPHSVGPATIRLLLGILYIAVFQIVNIVLPTDYMLTTHFDDLSLLSKCGYILIWGKNAVHKYIGCWMVAEASCILIGLSYNGKDINGNVLWDGCTNMKLFQYETCTDLHHLVDSFNHNTNKWMARYVFKRLRFLGNKQLSQIITLSYLAVWHGIHSGYYMNFFLEFLISNALSEFIKFSHKLRILRNINDSTTLKPLVWIVKKITITFALSYALVSFVLLSADSYMKVYRSVYYIGHLFYLALPIVCLLLSMMLPKPSSVNGVHTTRVDKKTS